MVKGPRGYHGAANLRHFDNYAGLRHYSGHFSQNWVAKHPDKKQLKGGLLMSELDRAWSLVVWSGCRQHVMLLSCFWIRKQGERRKQTQTINPKGTPPPPVNPPLQPASTSERSRHFQNIASGCTPNVQTHEPTFNKSFVVA